MPLTEHEPRLAPTPGCSFVARCSFDFADRRFEAGDPFPYAELGLVEDQAWQLWRAAQLDVAPASANTVSVLVTPGERVTIAPPKPQRTTRK